MRTYFGNHFRFSLSIAISLFLQSAFVNFSKAAVQVEVEFSCGIQNGVLSNNSSDNVVTVTAIDNSGNPVTDAQLDLEILLYGNTYDSSFSQISPGIYEVDILAALFVGKGRYELIVTSPSQGQANSSGEFLIVDKDRFFAIPSENFWIYASGPTDYIEVEVEGLLFHAYCMIHYDSTLGTDRGAWLITTPSGGVPGDSIYYRNSCIVASVHRDLMRDPDWLDDQATRYERIVRWGNVSFIMKEIRDFFAQWLGALLETWIRKDPTIFIGKVNSDISNTLVNIIDDFYSSGDVNTEAMLKEIAEGYLFLYASHLRECASMVRDHYSPWGDINGTKLRWNDTEAFQYYLKLKPALTEGLSFSEFLVTCLPDSSIVSQIRDIAIEICQGAPTCNKVSNAYDIVYGYFSNDPDLENVRTAIGIGHGKHEEHFEQYERMISHDGEHLFNYYSTRSPVCIDQDSDGQLPIYCGGLDCNDDNSSIGPTAIEICGNSVDENCDGIAESCAGAGLSVSTTFVDFGDVSPNYYNYQCFSIINTGGVTLSWHIGVDQPWLGVSPQSGNTVNSTSICTYINIPGDAYEGDWDGLIDIDAGSAGRELVAVTAHVILSDHPPDLRNGDVDPMTGMESDSFTFTVDYKDLEGDSPSQSDLVIVRPSLGNLVVDMPDPGGDLSLWTEFSVDVLGSDMGVDTWGYYFEFSNAGGSDRRPSSGTFTGPTVQVDTPPWMNVLEPTRSVAVSSGGSFEITWESMGCTSVSLYYDNDKDPSSTVPISGATGLAPVGFFNWNTTGVTDGTYYIYGICWNSYGDSDDNYSTGRVSIGDYVVSDRIWQTPVAMDIGGSRPDVTVSGDGTIHVVWTGGGGISYSQSSDGETWTQPALISILTAAQSIYRGPTIEVDSSNDVHVAYVVEDYSSTFVAYVMRVKLDGSGSIIYPQQAVGQETDTTRHQSVAIDGNDNVHIAWMAYGASGEGNIRYVRSVDGGNSYSAKVTLFPESGNDGWEWTDMDASGSLVEIIAGYNAFSTDRYIAHARSTDFGATFSSSSRIDTTCGTGSLSCSSPRVAVEGSNVYTAWSGSSSNESFSRSTNNGASFSTEVDIPVLKGAASDIASFGNEVYFVVMNGGVFFTESPNEGVSWSYETVITTDTGSGAKIHEGPEGHVHMVYDTGGQVYYVQGMSPGACPSITVESPSSSGSRADNSYQITWTHLGKGMEGIITLLYDDDLNSGGMYPVEGASGLPNTGSFTWDTSTIAGGEYFICATLSAGDCERSDCSDGIVAINHKVILQVTSPPAGGEGGQGMYNVQWSATDPDGDVVVTHLYYDFDMDTSEKHSIRLGIRDESEYMWSLGALNHGDIVYIYVEATDGINPTVGVYSPGQLVVYHEGYDCVFDSDCTSPNVCVDWFCICQPDCFGKECGDDGCGGLCGSCSAEEDCDNGQCVPKCTCTDGDNDGHFPDSCADTDCSPRDDCDDARASVHPGATEVCSNNIDDDCDGQTDEGCSGPCDCTDSDGDGHYPDTCTDTDCTPRDDCDDTRSAVRPGATESCNGIDDDCDGSTDEGCPPCDCPDYDGDGHYPTWCDDTDCIPRDDCDDNPAPAGCGANCHPGRTETCNDGYDNNCNGQTDEGCDVCGDGSCTGTENYQNCCQDCECPAGTICQNGNCEPVQPCGDGICSVNENCGLCPIDCECARGWICEGQICVKDGDDGGCGCGGNNTPFSMGIYLLFAIIGLKRIRRMIRH